MQLLLQGSEFNEIRQYAASKGWDLTDRQVRRFINAAYSGPPVTAASRRGP